LTMAGCTNPPDVWVGVCLLLEAFIPLALVGLGLMNSGFARTRAVSHVLFTSLCAGAISGLAYLSIGFMWQSAPCLGWIGIPFGGRVWNVLGNGPFLLHRVDAGQSGVLLLVILAFSALLFAQRYRSVRQAKGGRLVPLCWQQVCNPHSCFRFTCIGHGRADG
jgi:ammonia channel protein AmtB